MNLVDMLSLAPVVPVLTIEDVEDAVPMAAALVAGGLPLIEVTLRTPAALECIKRIAGEFAGAVVGAGTVRDIKTLEAAQAAGARFIVSPGFSAAMVAATESPIVPGVSSASEVMAALEAGCRFCKLFPAEAVGGVTLLKALRGPFPDVRFCPTGGISPQNAPHYLAQPNVVCVGGSWVTPKHIVAAKDWAKVEMLAFLASGLAVQ